MNLKKRHNLFFLMVAVFGLLAAAATLPAQQDSPATGSEDELLEILDSDAPIFNKAKACQQLAVVGTKKSVPILAKLLADEQMAHYARFALESNPDPSVDEALRNALESLEDGLLIGVINSIGERRDVNAVAQIKPLLTGANAQVAAAAAAALGRIACEESAAVLLPALTKPEPLRSAVADACLTAADTLAKAGKGAEALKILEAVRQSDVPRFMQLAALSGSIRTLGSGDVTLLTEQLQSDDPQRLAVGLSMAHTIQGEAITNALIAELAKPYTKPANDNTTLVIVDGKYGADDKWVDVTDTLTSAADPNGLTIKADNHLAGNPAPKSKKTLRVKYLLGDDIKVVDTPEGDTLTLAGSPPQNTRHAKIVAVLQQRGDKAALPGILKAAGEAPWDVRLPAVRALASLGDASAVELLLATALADQGALSREALGSLAQIADDGADQQIQAKLTESKGQAQLVLIQLIGLREITSAVPTLLDLSGSDDPQVSQAALDALGLTVSLEELPTLVRMLVKTATPEATLAIKSALQKACQRTPDRDATSTILLDQMQGASIETKADLLDLLGVTGGDKALTGVADAANSDDLQMVDAATRVLGTWMTADAAPVLLKLATSGNPQFRIRSLRGYIRIPRQLNVTPDEKLVMSVLALKTATRDQERALVITDVLAGIPSPNALSIVMPFLKSPELKDDACAAAVAIAQKIVKTDPDAVAAAMPEVIQAADDRTTAAKARKLLRQTQ